MKTRTKALLLALSAVLLVVSTVMATMAFLTSQTGVVTNTFSVGNVKITLDEAPVDVYGDPIEGNRRTENAYKLIPGHEYDKDPTIHVDPASEACWIFVKIENGISAIEKAGETTIAAQMAANGWTPVEGLTNVYAYANKVDPAVSGADLDIEIFANFTVDGEAKLYADDGTTALYSADTPITIIGYAVQADGFNSAAEAWEAAPATWNN